MVCWVYGNSSSKHIPSIQTMAQTQTQTQTQDYWTAQADAVSIWAPEQKAATAPKWDDFKYGLCEWCSKGLEDKSDFVVTEGGYGHTVLVCYECYSK